MFHEHLLVGGDVDAVHLVVGDEALEPSDLGPEIGDDGVRIGRSLSEGALYHHFSGKEELFRLVFESVKRELSSHLVAVLLDADPWMGIVAACRTYIDTHTDPAVMRIVLLDARAVLSSEAWRSVDGQWGAVMFRGAFRRAINRGIVMPLPLNTLAMIVTGALAEACLLVADAGDPDAMRDEALSIVVQLLQGLRLTD